MRCACGRRGSPGSRESGEARRAARRDDRSDALANLAEMLGRRGKHAEAVAAMQERAQGWTKRAAGRRRDPGVHLEAHRVDPLALSQAAAKRSSSSRSAEGDAARLIHAGAARPGLFRRSCRGGSAVDRPWRSGSRPAARLRTRQRRNPGRREEPARCCASSSTCCASLPKTRGGPSRKRELSSAAGTASRETYETRVCWHRPPAAGGRTFAHIAHPSVRRVRQALASRSSRAWPERRLPGSRPPLHAGDPGDEAGTLFSGTLKANRDYDVADPDTRGAKARSGAVGLGACTIRGPAAEPLQRRVPDASPAAARAIRVLEGSRIRPAARLQSDHRCGRGDARVPALPARRVSGSAAGGCRDACLPPSWRAPGRSGRRARALRLAGLRVWFGVEERGLLAATGTRHRGPHPGKRGRAPELGRDIDRIRICSGRARSVDLIAANSSAICRRGGSPVRR